MELLCPDCLGTLEFVDGGSVRCTVHGGEYKVLFSKFAPETKRPEIYETALAGGGQQGNAVSVPAGSVVGSAGFSGGTAHRCIQHPNVPATVQCRVCGAYVCATCDFALPGGVHVCPTCASKPRTALSPHRKKLLIASFILAGWSTAGMTCLLAGVFGAVRTEAEQQVLGTVLMLFVMFPVLIGLALGLSARNRRLHNPVAITIAVVWNGLLAASFILLCLIGLMKG